MHGPRQYDPAKAHAYYLRTRKLHPRQKGQMLPPGRRPGGVVNQKKQAFPKIKLNPHELRVQRAKADAQVRALTDVLKKLQDELKKQTVHDKKPTVVDKSKAARQSKKFRQAHKQELKAKAKAKRAAAKSSGGKSSGGNVSKSKSQSVASLKKTISKVKNELAAAKARQKALA